MSWFNQGLSFWQSQGMEIVKCQPLPLTDHNGKYRCFAVGERNIEWFWDEVLHHLGNLQGQGRTYFTTLVEAREETRKHLISQIKYWNNSRFKTNPIGIADDGIEKLKILTSALETIGKRCRTVRVRKPKGFTCLDEYKEVIAGNLNYGDPLLTRVKNKETLCLSCQAKFALELINWK